MKLRVKVKTSFIVNSFKIIHLSLLTLSHILQHIQSLRRLFESHLCIYKKVIKVNYLENTKKLKNADVLIITEYELGPIVAVCVL